MRTVDLSNESLNLEELLQIAREQNLVLKLPDGKVFLLAEVEDDLQQDEDFADEIERTRQNQEAIGLNTKKPVQS